MENGGAVSFEIDGHVYTSTLLPAEEGIEVIAALVALAGEPLAAVLESVLGDPKRLALLARAATDEGDTTSISDLLGGVSLAQVGAALRTGLAGAKAVPVVRALVKWTHRDGKALRDPGEFNAAYRGNYGELARALFEIVKVNRLFPLPGI